MALETNNFLGNGGAGMQGDGPGTAARMIRELQGLTTKVVDGAAANTNIAIAGIKLTDTLQSVIEYVGGVPTDRLSVSAITSAGNIRLTTVSTGNKLAVTYFVKPA